MVYTLYALYTIAYNYIILSFDTISNTSNSPAIKEKLNDEIAENEVAAVSKLTGENARKF
jgi:hypothetical protein